MATRRSEERLAEFLRQSPRMARWSLGSFPAADVAGAAALRAALEWRDAIAEGADSNLWIFGPVGTGKSGLAWSLARAWKEEFPWDSVRFAPVLGWLDAARRSIETRGDTVDPSYDLVYADLLVLDDLGAARPSPSGFAEEKLATVVEARYEAGALTIATSNYAPHELVRRLGRDDSVIGRRIVSRLLEGAVQIRLDRPDLRLGGAA